MDEVTTDNENNSVDTQALQNGEKTLSSLELPDMSFSKMIGHFGPGIILMMTGIGTSHIITAPTAGGRFAYALMWCIPVAYIFKSTVSKWLFDLPMQPQQPRRSCR